MGQMTETFPGDHLKIAWKLNALFEVDLNGK